MTNLEDILDAELTHGHRLSDATRERLFEAVTDLADKHQLPLQNMSGFPGIAEAGDVCGDVETLVLAWLRAFRATDTTRCFAQKVDEPNEWFVAGTLDIDEAATAVASRLLADHGYVDSRQAIHQLQYAEYLPAADWVLVSHMADRTDSLPFRLRREHGDKTLPRLTGVRVRL